MRGDVDKRLGEMRLLTRWERRITWLALIVVVAMALFPPWVHTLNRPGKVSFERPAGYAFLAEPPAPRGPIGGVSIDLTRLLIQIAAVAVFAGGGLFLRRRP